MNFLAFLWSFLFWLLIVIPAGPIALLVIQRSIQCDTRSGIFTGFGSALADMIYVLMAWFGVVLVSRFIDNYEFEFGIIGVWILFLFGVKILFDTPVIPSKIAIDQKLVFDSVSWFLLSIINVGNLLIFSALFIHLQEFQTASRALFVTQCALWIFIGTILWWSLLSYITHRTKNRFSDQRFIQFHKFSGWLMIGLSVLLLINILFFN